MDFRRTQSRDGMGRNSVSPSSGIGRASPWKDMARHERLVAFADNAFQILCQQIESDYILFFRRHVQGRIAPDCRLNVRQHAMMICLGSFTVPMTGADIARTLRTDKATVSRSLKTLRRAGLTKEADNPSDSRSRMISLSSEGQALHEAYLDAWEAAVACVDRATGLPMTEEAFATRVAILHRIKDRARAFADYRPGRRVEFRKGFSRPDASQQHDLARMRRAPDSYLRFFAEFISEDYLDCLSSRAVKPIIGDRRINVTDLRTMMAVDFNNAPATQAEISRIMRFDSATVTRSAQSLEEAGLVEIAALDGDRRTRGLKLTVAGHRLARAYRERCARLVGTIERQYGIPWSRSNRADMLAVLVDIRDRAARLADFGG